MDTKAGQLTAVAMVTDSEPLMMGAAVANAMGVASLAGVLTLSKTLTLASATLSFFLGGGCSPAADPLAGVAASEGTASLG